MNEVDKIKELATQLVEARTCKAQLEQQVKDINKLIKDIEEKELSSLLDEQGISKISIEDMDISKSLIFRGGYTKHTDPEAFQFLFDSNNDGALKQHLIVDLSACPRAPFELDEKDIPYTIEYSIHHATLSSILKELVESGKFTTDDIEKYSVYVQPQVKIKMK